MKLSSAAMGLAAVGAGWLVARMVMQRRGGAGWAATPEPPSPEQLIGRPQARLSAMEVAETLRTQPPGRA